MSDALFDFADFEPKPTYQGRAPLTFTRDYFHPNELNAASQWLRYEEGLSFGSAVGRIHTWMFGIATGWAVPEGAAEHSLALLRCCLSCFDYPTHDIDRARSWERRETLRTCYCVQLDLHQANCSACEWHHITDNEQDAIEAWHDHAFPGWRELPVCPIPFSGMGGDKKAITWVKENYPVEMQRPFAPVLTERQPVGTRSVPGRSPWGGFDLCGRIRKVAV